MINSALYDDIVPKIKDVYYSCSAYEQQLLFQILNEISIYGDSETLEKLWLADFKSVPVGISTFLSQEEYLGLTNNFGDSVYPFWKSALGEIFSSGNRFYEIVLSGATRIGKTSTAVTIMAYMLYRLMLYRDPHKYFHKKAISRFTLIFANLTKELAEGVAFHEFNSTLKESPWFKEHGTFNKSINNPVYIPEGDKIDIIPVSDASHALGMQVWCLKGDTKILTDEGPKTLAECSGTYQNVLQLVDNRLIPTYARVECTKYVIETTRIELEDGTIIEGTPDHKVMLSDGTYKPLGELTEHDKLFDTVIFIEIKSIQRIEYCEPIPVYDVLNVNPNHNFAIQGEGSTLISHNCAVMDEANFAKAGIKDINKAKTHMKNLYDTINARISGTFRLNGEVYGKMVTSSSKNTDSDYLSDHIDKQIASGNTSMYLVDEPQWKILPKEMFSGKTFLFTVGDRYKKGFVIDDANSDDAHIAEYESQGYRIVQAPLEFKKNFIADYDISLRDIAGISVVGAMGFFTQELVTPCVSTERKNPFFTDIIETGTKDPAQIESFFHMEVVPNAFKFKQMNIHLDLSETGDKTGLSGCCVDGNKIVEIDGKKVSRPFIKQVFSVAIKCPQGDRLSFQKIVNFIVWLRRSGFNIGVVSTDQFQSSYLREVLNQQGFMTDKVSVDTSIEPYTSLRGLMIDQCIELVKNQLQEDELVKLERINNKIDHPANFSKDVADALCGSSCTLLTGDVKDTIPSHSIAKIASAVNATSRYTPYSKQVGQLFGPQFNR